MTHRLTVTSLAPLLLVLAGCPQPIEIASTDLRADAAVAPLPPRSLCKHEPQDVTKIPAAGDRFLAAFVRDRDEAVLISVVDASESTKAKVRLDAINRSGEPNTIAEIDQTGPAAEIIGLSALLAGGKIRIALTRPEGRVDVLTLDTNGALRGPVQHVDFDAGSAQVAKLHQLDGDPLLALGGSIKRLDGSSYHLTAGAGGDAGPGADGGPMTADGGAAVGDAAAAATIALPAGVTSFIVAGDTLGWLRSGEDGVFLEHFDDESGSTLAVKVAPAGHEARGLWAGDRYLVSDLDGADLARFVIDRPSKRNEQSSPRLRLGGRMTLPRPPSVLQQTSWHNAGARHVGLARQITPRRLEFINVALGGLIFDAVTTIETEQNILGSTVMWDGHGYVLAWATALGDGDAQLRVTRFSCPDDQ